MFFFFISEICHWISSDFRICCRGFTRLRLSEFVQISEFFQFYITDICQTSESFSKSVNLNEERAVKQSRTVPKVCRRIRMHIDCKQADSTILKVLLWIIARSRDQTKPKTHFCRETGYVANTRFFGLVFTQILLR